MLHGLGFSVPGWLTDFVCNVSKVRPFTLGQLKELLNRTGTVVEEGFWIDKIKSHCYVTVSLFQHSSGSFFCFGEFLCVLPSLLPIFAFPQYSSAEEAMATRTALHGVKWPQSNPKFLSVDFCSQEEVRILFKWWSLMLRCITFSNTLLILVHPSWTSTGVWVQQEKSQQRSLVGRQPLGLAVQYPRLSYQSVISGQNEKEKWKGGRERVQRENGTEIKWETSAKLERSGKLGPEDHVHGIVRDGAKKEGRAKRGKRIRRVRKI